MRRVVLYTLSLVYLSGTSFAEDIPEQNFPNSNGLAQEENAITSQAKAIKYLTKQLKDMEQKNWDMAETINKLRSNIDSGVVYTPSFEPNIIGLIEENKRLSALIKNGSSQQYEAKNRDLQSEINSLKLKNRDLSTSLERALEESRRKNEFYVSRKNHNEKKPDTKSLSIIMNKLDKLQRENISLKDKIRNQDTNKIPNRSLVSNDDEVAALKTKIKRLGETIRAQNDSLIAADNAEKTADRLLTENLILQRNIDKSKQVRLYEGKSAKELLARNKILQSEIVKRDNYINKMLMSNNNVATKSNNILESNALPVIDAPANSYSGGQNLDALFDKNKRLEDDLLTEREATVSYRKKISEYQKEIEKLNALRSSK